MTQKINLLIVDDHKLFSDGLKAMLENFKPIGEIHQLYTGNVVIEYLRKNKQITLVLLDINLPDLEGDTIAVEIKKYFNNVAILVVSMNSSLAFIQKIKTIGVNGFIHKSASFDDVSSAINLIISGRRYFPSTFEINNDENTEKAIFDRLTLREIEVIKYILAGKTTVQIAEIMCVSFHTIVSHRKNIHLKLKINNERDLVKYAIKLKFLL